MFNAWEVVQLSAQDLKDLKQGREYRIELARRNKAEDEWRYWDQISSPADWEEAATRMRLCHSCGNDALGYRCQLCHRNFGIYTQRAWKEFIKENMSQPQGMRIYICPVCNEYNRNATDGCDTRFRLLEKEETNLCRDCDFKLNPRPLRDKCSDYLENHEEPILEIIKDPPRASAEMVHNGEIYFICDENNLFVKIGKTAVSTESRLRAFQCGSPVPVTIIYSYKAKDIHSEEKRLHSEFKHKRIRGEWFSYPGEIESFIKSKKSEYEQAKEKA